MNGHKTFKKERATLGLVISPGYKTVQVGEMGTIRGNIRTACRTASDILVAASKTENLFVGLDLE